MVPAGAGQYRALLKRSIESEAFTTPLQLCGVVRHSHEGDPSSLHLYCGQIHELKRLKLGSMRVEFQIVYNIMLSMIKEYGVI